MAAAKPDKPDVLWANTQFDFSAFGGSGEVKRARAKRPSIADGKCRRAVCVCVCTRYWISTETNIDDTFVACVCRGMQELESGNWGGESRKIVRNQGFRNGIRFRLATFHTVPLLHFGIFARKKNPQQIGTLYLNYYIQICITF